MISYFTPVILITAASLALFSNIDRKLSLLSLVYPIKNNPLQDKTKNVSRPIRNTLERVRRYKALTISMAVGAYIITSLVVIILELAVSVNIDYTSQAFLAEEKVCSIINWVLIILLLRLISISYYELDKVHTELNNHNIREILESTES